MTAMKSDRSPGQVRLSVLHDHVATMTDKQRASFEAFLIGCLAALVSDEDWNEAMKNADTVARGVKVRRSSNRALRE